MENERNEAFKNEKVCEQRLEIAQEENTKALAKIKSKYEQKNSELEE